MPIVSSPLPTSPLATTPKSRSRATPYLPSYMTDNQTCVVCGDAATGLHYSAITCEGCKGFFRRTSQRHLVYECKEKEQCPINKDTRNFCQRCRFLKCIAVGMSTELVLNDTERVHKRELILENRTRRSHECVIAQLRSQSPVTVEEEMMNAINALTKEFLQYLDTPTQTETDVELAVPALLARVRTFALSLPAFASLPRHSQFTLLSRNFLGVQLLRLCAAYDEEADCLRPSEGVTLTRSSLSLHLPSPLVDVLFSHAATLSSLAVDNRILAVMAAFLLIDTP